MRAGHPINPAHMGTILNGRVVVFRTIAAALARHKDLQLVLSVGDQVDPQQVRPAPNNAIIVKRAPQLELLKTYRDNAGRLQKAIAEANGISAAADLIEESLGVTKNADGR